ncbi:MAG: hypothetical protein Q8O03_04485 [Nanoarchaeota archaeon]|nr:hypothetical protein [Nanoarchaeota archaeon]
MKGLKEKIVEQKTERELELSDYLRPWERFEPIHSVDEKAEGLYKTGGKVYLP